MPKAKKQYVRFVKCPPQGSPSTPSSESNLDPRIDGSPRVYAPERVDEDDGAVTLSDYGDEESDDSNNSLGPHLDDSPRVYVSGDLSSP